MEISSIQGPTPAAQIVLVENHLNNQVVDIFKKQDQVKQTAEKLNNSLTIYQANVGTLDLVKNIKSGLPSLAVLNKGSHAYNITEKGLSIQNKLEMLYRQFSSNIEQLLIQLESLETNVKALEQKFKLMIDDTSLRFDYKFFQVPLQKVMTIVNRISSDSFDFQVQETFKEVYKLSSELAILSTELPQGDSQNAKQDEKEKKLQDAKEKTQNILNEKAKIQAKLSQCLSSIESYTDKISIIGEKIQQLRENIEEIDNKVRDFQKLKYQEANVATSRLNELKDFEFQQLMKQQNQLNEDKDRL